LAPWDFAAGVLLVREAGGVVTTVSGREVPLTHSSLLAGNPAMHRWLARTLADATPAGATL
ncbi:MAG TPA: inositol monophosphatase family protein, partial [Gemmatimonadaceae bacterium]|nr:inositol monophosphatase family protein [Gemmatimonadaceae bacterium]